MHALVLKKNSACTGIKKCSACTGTGVEEEVHVQY